jgi:ubiquinone/menaquinone biosynthesis C-methylase UbiE
VSVNEAAMARAMTLGARTVAYVLIRGLAVLGGLMICTNVWILAMVWLIDTSACLIRQKGAASLIRFSWRPTSSPGGLVRLAAWFSVGGRVVRTGWPDGMAGLDRAVAGDGADGCGRSLTEMGMNELDRIREVYAQRRAGGREDRYTVFDRANLFRLLSLERELVEALRRERLTDLAGLRALDVGCGGGWWLRTLLRWGARAEHLAGIDLLDEAVAAARRVHPDLRVEQGSAERLPFPDRAFDLVSQFTVFSSVLDGEMRRRMAGEMLRVLRPGGILLSYDFTLNPRNPDTTGITRAELASLFAGCRVRARRVTLAPPLARMVVPRSWIAAEVLERVPVLRSHLLVTVRVPQRST